MPALISRQSFYNRNLALYTVPEGVLKPLPIRPKESSLALAKVRTDDSLMGRIDPAASGPSPPFLFSHGQAINDRKDEKATPQPVEEAKNEEEDLEVPVAREKRSKDPEAKAYRKRNVYKAVIRKMFVRTREQRDAIVALLREKGYTIEQIEHAFYQIALFNDLEREKGQAKKSQALIKQMISKLSIYTYILHDTLQIMLKTWDTGKSGRISALNLVVYKRVCEGFLADTLRLLAR